MVHAESFDVRDRREDRIGRLEVHIEVLEERPVLESGGSGVAGGSVYERLSVGCEPIEPLSERSEAVVAGVQFLEPECQEVMVADARQSIVYRVDPIDRASERFGLPIERSQHRFRFLPSFPRHRSDRRFQFRSEAPAGIRSQSRGDGVSEFGPKSGDERFRVGEILDTTGADGFGEPFPDASPSDDPIDRPDRTRT